MRSKRYILIILSLVLLIASATTIIIYLLEWSEESLRLIISWSAKISAVLFSVAFGISSFHYLLKDKYSRKALQNRAEIGLSFVVFHTAHLISLVILQEVFHPVFDLAKTISLIGGGLAYFFIFLMFITTFPGPKKWLGKRNWKILHLIGGYWIWMIFFRTYTKNLINGGSEYFLFGLLLFVLIIRMYSLLKVNKKSAILKTAD